MGNSTSTLCSSCSSSSPYGSSKAHITRILPGGAIEYSDIGHPGIHIGQDCWCQSRSIDIAVKNIDYHSIVKNIDYNSIITTAMNQSKK